MGISQQNILSHRSPAAKELVCRSATEPIRKLDHTARDQGTLAAPNNVYLGIVCETQETLRSRRIQQAVCILGHWPAEQAKDTQTRSATKQTKKDQEVEGTLDFTRYS